MGYPSIGAQIAATLGFVLMTLLLGPVMTLAAPSSFSTAYFGVNGIVNTTFNQYSTKFALPVLQTANTTTGFQAAGNLLNSAFSPLAFIYGGLGLFWKSLTNMPTLLYMMMSSMSSNIAFLPVFLGAVVSILAFEYIMIGNFIRVLLWWMKSQDTSEMVGG